MSKLFYSYNTFYSADKISSYAKTLHMPFSLIVLEFLISEYNSSAWWTENENELNWKDP